MNPINRISIYSNKTHNTSTELDGSAFLINCVGPCKIYRLGQTYLTFKQTELMGVFHAPPINRVNTCISRSRLFSASDVQRRSAFIYVLGIRTFPPRTFPPDE